MQSTLGSVLPRPLVTTAMSLFLTLSSLSAAKNILTHGPPIDLSNFITTAASNELLSWLARLLHSGGQEKAASTVFCICIQALLPLLLWVRVVAGIETLAARGADMEAIFSREEGMVFG